MLLTSALPCIVETLLTAAHMNSQLLKGLDSSSAPSFSEIDELALVRKIDMRLLPILFLIYVTAFLDR